MNQPIQEYLRNKEAREQMSYTYLGWVVSQFEIIFFLVTLLSGRLDLNNGSQTTKYLTCIGCQGETSKPLLGWKELSVSQLLCKSFDLRTIAIRPKHGLTNRYKFKQFLLIKS